MFEQLNLILGKLIRVGSETHPRHSIKYFIFSNVSNIGFPTPVLQFGNKGSKTLLKKENMCFSSMDLHIELVQSARYATLLFHASSLK